MINVKFCMNLGLENAIDENMFKDGGVWYCKACSYQTERKSNMKDHVEGKHLSQNFGFLCQSCNKTYKTKASLRDHNKRCKNIII